jgi:hypothetical protein
MPKPKVVRYEPPEPAIGQIWQCRNQYNRALIVQCIPIGGVVADVKAWIYVAGADASHFHNDFNYQPVTLKNGTRYLRLTGMSRASPDDLVQCLHTGQVAGMDIARRNNRWNCGINGGQVYDRQR